MSTLVLAAVCCGLYPLIVFGIGRVAFRDKANGSLIVDKDGTVAWLKAARPGLHRRQVFSTRAPRRRATATTPPLQRQQPGPDLGKAERRHQGSPEAYRKENGLKETDAVPLTP